MTDNPTPIAIRPATPDDAELVMRFIRDLAEYERLAHEVIATGEDIDRALFGARPFAEVIIAEYENEPAGFALFFHTFSTFLGQPGIYLEDLFVLPELRGKGIGRALLAHLARLTVERGCGRLEWSVLDWNEPAIGFYRSLGSVPMDEWTVHRVTGEALRKLGGLTIYD